MSAPSDFKVTEFIAYCLDQIRANGETAATNIQERMRQLTPHPEQVLAALPRDDSSDETLVHASPELTVVRVEGLPGISYPPHNHKMTAIIAVLTGEETNTYYRATRDGVDPRGVRTVAAGEVLRMVPSVIHSVANRGAERCVGLHVYFGDLFNTDRTIWHPDTGERFPYSNETYFSLARQLSAAERPRT